MANLDVMRNYLIGERIEKEIKANITCLMTNTLIPYFSCELIESTGIDDNNEFQPVSKMNKF